MVTVFTFPHVWITEEKYKECEGRRGGEEKEGEERRREFQEGDPIITNVFMILSTKLTKVKKSFPVGWWVPSRNTMDLVAAFLKLIEKNCCRTFYFSMLHKLQTIQCIHYKILCVYTKYNIVFC